MHNEDYFEGYKFTEVELNILLSGVGLEDSHGIPMSETQYSEEELLDAANSLIRKKVLIPDGNSEYTLAEPFRTVLLSIKNSGRTVSLVSGNYLAWGYVCFPAISGGEEKPFTVCRIDQYVKNKFTLFAISADEFCDHLFDEEFIPAVTEYCRKIPSKLNLYVKESIDNMKVGNDPVGIKPRLTVKLYDSESCDEKYLMVSRDLNGSYLSIVADGECSSVAYSKDDLRNRLMMLFEKGELV